MTVKKFMLKKFPTNKYMDCPVPIHHWETIQEYANEYASEQLTAAEARIKELEEGLRNLRHGYFNDAEAVDNYIDQLLNK